MRRVREQIAMLFWIIVVMLSTIFSVLLGKFLHSLDVDAKKNHKEETRERVKLEDFGMGEVPPNKLRGLNG